MKTVHFSTSLLQFAHDAPVRSQMHRTTVRNLIAATGGRLVGADSADAGFARVAIDSRCIKTGDAFWALEGDVHNGHDFVAEAFSRGAAVAVVHEWHAPRAGRPLVLVNETQQALMDFAGWYRRRREALVVGVTGSVGKTTTREMIHRALSTRFQCTQSPKNYNNHVGVPLSVLQIEQQHAFAILELGASQTGEIRRLAKIAAPNIGVVTSVAPAHLDGFGDEQQIAQAKAELIEALPSTGLAILAGDDERVRSMAERAACPVLFVGEGLENNLRAESVEARPDRLTLRVDGDVYEIPVTGRHHVTAALAAIAVARQAGLSAEDIATGLSGFRPLPGRCRLEQLGACTIIDDTYNANPRSMQAACELLSELPAAGKKILVVGDMLELGSRDVEYHRQLGQSAAELEIDCLLAFGRYAHEVVRGSMSAGNACQQREACDRFDSVMAILNSWLEPGDVVLVKGSRAMEMQRVVERLRQSVQETLEENSARDRSRACV